MGKREEITDLVSDEGIKDIKVGTILKYQLDGTNINIKVTRKDTKAMRIWGEHIDTYDVDNIQSHYGHNLDVTGSLPFCSDCEIIITEASTIKGTQKHADRVKESRKPQIK